MLAIAVLTLVLGAGLATATADERSVVDLGYALHRADFNASGGSYTFSNIRYADPPIGNNRFQPPVAVSTVDRTVKNGSVGNICMQSYPEWQLVRSAARENISVAELRKRLESNPRQNEDCLFLDVVVPKSVLDRRGEAQYRGAPVMVWIYGGGYVSGSKGGQQFDPSGLIARAQDEDGEGVVYVAMNYRLGMYGWLNALGDKSVYPNVGLQDQRFALEWVRENIHLFGGDAGRVTAFGESAGGGSLMFHLTAEDGNASLPMQRALIQSPGFQPVLDLKGILKRVYATASQISGRNIRNGAELASLDAAVLAKINNKVVANSPELTYTFGPTIDGSYVRDIPSVRLAEGRFNTKPQLMIGHNLREGDFYVPPWSKITAAELAARIDDTFATIPRRRRREILAKVYPPPPQKDYATDQARASLLLTEAFFACNTRSLAEARNGDAWSYRFQVPPAKHGDDVPYTFYHGDAASTNATTAEAMQTYFTNFAAGGSVDANPGRGLPRWRKYGRYGRLKTFGEDGVGNDEDDMRNARCDYWMNGRYRF